MGNNLLMLRSHAKRAKSLLALADGSAKVVETVDPDVMVDMSARRDGVVCAGRPEEEMTVGKNILFITHSNISPMSPMAEGDIGDIGDV